MAWDQCHSKGEAVPQEDEQDRLTVWHGEVIHLSQQIWGYCSLFSLFVALNCRRCYLDIKQIKEELRKDP